jgi:hypothetical protein
MARGEERRRHRPGSVRQWRGVVVEVGARMRGRGRGDGGGGEEEGGRTNEGARDLTLKIGWQTRACGLEWKADTRRMTHQRFVLLSFFLGVEIRVHTFGCLFKKTFLVYVW